MQYSTVLYSTVKYSTVQYSTVQYSAVQYSTVLGGADDRHYISPDNGTPYLPPRLLHCTAALHCTALCCNALNWTEILDCTGLHCSALHFSVLHSSVPLYSAAWWNVRMTVVVFPHTAEKLPHLACAVGTQPLNSTILDIITTHILKYELWSCPGYISSLQLSALNIEQCRYLPQKPPCQLICIIHQPCHNDYVVSYTPLTWFYTTEIEICYFCLPDDIATVYLCYNCTVYLS